MQDRTSDKVALNVLVVEIYGFLQNAGILNALIIYILNLYDLGVPRELTR